MIAPTDRELFWADAVARSLPADVPHVIRDSKTPSGTVPISSLRGPIITDALYRTFRARGLEVRFVFTVDDYDPMDSQSMRSQEGMAEHMGKPFFAIPSPDPSATDYADYHIGRFLATFADLGIRPEVHRTRDLYREGRFDRAIDLVLRNAAVVREIYERVANVRRDERWFPLFVICERCGRVGTTKVTGYDGALVTYECTAEYVKGWAEGCGHRASVSPFGGRAKLPWNLEWCAKWDHFDVTYEEGGKDLLTAGGSRDRSNELYRTIWKREPPPGLMHEFLTIGGRKMSTSRPETWRDQGSAAHELVQVYPGELVRFLMLRTPPHRHIEFDPAGTSLPRLMDEYDRCADAYLEDSASDLARVWALSQLASEPQPIAFRARFGLIADWLQIPSIDVPREAARRKRSPLNELEERDLRRRSDLARVWLERWAPDEARFAVAAALPEVARGLSAEQRAFLGRVSPEIGRLTEAEELQARLYEVAKESGLAADGKVSRDAFAAIYLAFIGKPHGPRAAWLLVTLDGAFVRGRLEEAAQA
ncbi:MAG: lysine--tRNA ligase [Candidatus Limnocylindria bacterium]